MRRDVIIAGAGIAGLATALELREHGATVLVVDRGRPGCEASSAAAGMLAATDPETPAALRDLASRAARMYPEFVAGVERISGISADFRRQGTIILGEESPPRNYQRLSRKELEQLEPHLDPNRYAAFFVAEDSVDPVLLIRAMVRAAESVGIEIRSAVAVQQIRWAGLQVEVETASGRLTARAAVNCLGSWSGTPVRPRKGQMMYLQPRRPGLLQHVVRAPGAYIVPRSSGKILVGTTVEDVGFDKSVEPETIRIMHRSATRYLPELGSAATTETWAGLRPGTPDDLPLIGPTADRNVFMASGLFRNGILLAPAAAEIIAALVIGQPAPLEIAPFSPSRFTVAKARS